MNRRELFQRLLGAGTACGVPIAGISIVPASPKPALAMIEVSAPFTDEAYHGILQGWDLAVKGTPLEGVRGVIFDKSVRVTLLGADGRVLNRPLTEDPAV